MQSGADQGVSSLHVCQCMQQPVEQLSGMFARIALLAASLRHVVHKYSSFLSQNA